jgi:hypothetical protein
MTFPFSIGNGVLLPQLAADTLFLTIADVEGTYSIPYIQSSRTLSAVVTEHTKCNSIELSLYLANMLVAHRTVMPAVGSLCRFDDLSPGEYCLKVVLIASSGSPLKEYLIKRTGIGLIIAALGDSLTEGYYGNGFMTTENRIAQMFPCDAVSKDGRNFPQFAPTATQYLPSINCFESWMTDLNDLLSAGLKQPVFIANEGWGGCKTCDYVNLMQNDSAWQNRMKALKPDIWLIHLGVNDERSYVETYSAKPSNIFLAKPSYDYAPEGLQHLPDYCREIESIIEQLKISAGPDLYQFFSTDREKWYGEDMVHPNEEGMRYMARLWCDAILK